MKVDVTREIVNLRGVTFRTGDTPCPQCGNISDNAENLTLRSAMVQALTSFEKSDVDGEKKVKRFHLALKITDEDEPELTPEDLVLTRRLIGRIFAPVVVGRCWEMLE